jgi:hypothetical protein
MALILITGTLVQDAEVRTLPQGPDSTPMPVLVAIFDSDGPGQLPVKAELVYPPNLRPQAQQYAKTLKRGMRVSVTAPIHQIRTTLGHCQAIQQLREPAPDQSQLQLLEAAHG